MDVHPPKNGINMTFLPSNVKAVSSGSQQLPSLAASGLRQRPGEKKCYERLKQG
jgi:hypothetical protein